MMLTEQEIREAERSLRKACRCGAQKARVTLSKSVTDVYGTLNGELDKVNHCLDRSLTFCLFVDGRYGSFSTNRIGEAELDAFITRAVATVRMLAEDPCRDLPDPERTVKDAATGLELGLYDPAYGSVTAEERLRTAMDAALFKEYSGRIKLISEEGEYSDSLTDLLVLDSNGLRCRHTETSFGYAVEMTVQDAGGRKFSGFRWDAGPMRRNLDIAPVGRTALERAVAQIGPRNPRSGKYRMVVETECAAKLVSPVLKALGASSLQQKNSFLPDSLGKPVFPEWMTLLDRPRIPGQNGSKLFDSEGVATEEVPIIERGTVREYFVNTYMARKMGIAPTIEDATRPAVLPCAAPKLGGIPAGLDRSRMLELAGDGILVTGFNGGNSNSSTGDFSYGIEGFLFKEGKIVRPVREMLVTGNFLTLWNNLLAAGDDARPCMSKLIPTLAFENIDFSA